MRCLQTESDYQSYAGGEQSEADEGASGELLFHYQPRQEHRQKDGKFADAVDCNGICVTPVECIVFAKPCSAGCDARKREEYPGLCGDLLCAFIVLFDQNNGRREDKYDDSPVKSADVRGNIFQAELCEQGYESCENRA